MEPCGALAVDGSELCFGRPRAEAGHDRLFKPEGLWGGGSAA
jgi:hypothetical protein